MQVQGNKADTTLGSLFDQTDVSVKRDEKEDNHVIRQHCRDISCSSISLLLYRDSPVTTPNVHQMVFMLGDSDK